MISGARSAIRSAVSSIPLSKFCVRRLYAPSKEKTVFPELTFRTSKPANSERLTLMASLFSSGLNPRGNFSPAVWTATITDSSRRMRKCGRALMEFSLLAISVPKPAGRWPRPSVTARVPLRPPMPTSLRGSRRANNRTRPVTAWGGRGCRVRFFTLCPVGPSGKRTRIKTPGSVGALGLRRTRRMAPGWDRAISGNKT